MKKLVILCFAITASILAGCNTSESESLKEQNAQISFSAQVDTNSDALSVSSKSASVESFKNGDRIGLFVVPFLNSSTQGTIVSKYNYVDNVPFECNESGLFTASAGNTISFPTANTKVSLYAFAMYHEQFNELGDIPSATIWTIDSDQTSAEKLQKNDVMTAQSLTVTPNAAAPTLNFLHRLSIAQIEFAAPRSIQSSEVVDVQVELVSLNNTVNINLVGTAVPTISGTTKANFQAHQASKTDGENNTYNYVYEVIVAPQTVAHSTQIASITIITLDGKRHVYKCNVPATQTSGIQFISGTRTKIAVEFGAEAGIVDLGGTSITEWGNTDPIEMQVSRPCKLNFRISEVASQTFAAQINSASVTVDATTTVSANPTWNQATETLELSFVLSQNQFPDKLTAMTLNIDNTRYYYTSDPTFSSVSGLTIIGDPTDQDYDVVIATLTRLRTTI